MAVQDQIENVVVVAPHEPGVGQRQQQVDHLPGIGPAVDIVTGKNQLGIGVGGMHRVEQFPQRLVHSVDVTNDPVHRSPVYEPTAPRQDGDVG